MHQTERIKTITEILRQNGFVTVKYLTEELHYSTATINRDLNAMQNMNIVKRSYGGAELIKNKGTPLVFRYQKMRPQKNLIGKKAAELINDGDTVFIDGATTSQYIGKHIASKKNLRVITNNLSLASFLSEHGIEVICLGGRIVEPPAIAHGFETIENARRYNYDKAFFSVGSFSDSGVFGGSEMYGMLMRVVMENSKESFLVADHKKLNQPSPFNVGTFSLLSGVISDYEFPEDTKRRFSDTIFYKV